MSNRIVRLRTVERHDDRDLIQQALDGLKAATGIDGHIVPGAVRQQAHARIELAMGGKARRYAVEAKARIDRFVALANWKAQAGNKPPLLVTRAMSADMAQRCRELEIQFLDTAGNAYLNGPGAFVLVAGRKDGDRTLDPADRRGSSPAALRMIFALLVEPALLNAGYRAIGDAAGIAIGGIGPVLNNLEARGFVARSEKHGRQLQNVGLLLDEWVAGYVNRLRPKLRVRRFGASRDGGLLEGDVLPRQALWGGETAAALLSKYLKPARQTIYVQAENMDEVIKQLVQRHRLRADPHGPIEVVEAFWDLAQLEHAKAVVPPLLVYADLLASLDARNIEAAKLIRQKWIDHAERAA